jgi:uncharacterized protein (UPF0332 family)
MKEELQKVIAKAKDCLEDARYLLKGERHDAAVNRAYYSMFTAIQGLMLDKGIFVKTHAGTKAKFHELFLKSGLLPMQLGKIFEDAISLRHEADYEYDEIISKEDAQQTINEAEYFMKSIIEFIEKGN